MFKKKYEGTPPDLTTDHILTLIIEPMTEILDSIVNEPVRLLQISTIRNQISTTSDKKSIMADLL